MADNLPPTTPPATSEPGTKDPGNNGGSSGLIEEAKHFIKNPLGIIGLFIVLVYGVATITAGINMAKTGLDACHPITWFIITFPIIILLVFFVLVTEHHTKLYAPTDFLDPKDWIELQRLLIDAEKQLAQTPQAGAATAAFTQQSTTISEARAIVDKAIAKRMGIQ